MAGLEGRIALVTGASQGIGRAVALELARAGAIVAVAARNEAKLAEVVAEIEAAGGKAAARSRSRPQPRRCWSALARWRSW